MVDNLSKQLLDSLKPRLAKMNTDVAPVVAEDIRTRALENTNNGRAFGNDPYKKTYAPQTVKERKRGGYQTSHVDFRRKEKRIERMRVKKPINDHTGAEIGWNDASNGKLFNLHHKGEGKQPIRRIFPESPSSLPNDVHDNARNLIGELLRG